MWFCHVDNDVDFNHYDDNDDDSDADKEGKMLLMMTMQLIRGLPLLMILLQKLQLSYDIHNEVDKCNYDHYCVFEGRGDDDEYKHDGSVVNRHYECN